MSCVLLPHSTALIAHMIYLWVGAMDGVCLLVRPVRHGTLIRSRGVSANKLHKDAYAQAFKEIFNLDTHIDVMRGAANGTHPSCTQPDLLSTDTSFITCSY
eukprot:1159223-Pelagomonas_calceolata.AAC.2